MREEEIYLHSEFVFEFKEYIENQMESGGGDETFYAEKKELFLCEEPLKFLYETDDFSVDKKSCQNYFEEKKKSFVQISVKPEALQKIWFNTTKNGINLRPGTDKNGQVKEVTMGDDGVHGLIVGQTGSGKSVFLNNLIFNMLMEYAPWELDLYLADFKRVEFSRYMNTYKAPHVCVCAATSEIRYVLSLISYLVDCMNAREEFFARLGLAKIADFRDRYPDVVLPRMLLIVDEFQQMFSEASPKEGEQIRQMLASIVKKGRATGLHILFASQEMSQTLSRSVLGNFRIRFALNCNAGVSMDIIGNRGATSLSKGQVLFNTSDGTEETNRIFNVPFIETGEEGDTISYFYNYLRMLESYAENLHFHKVQKFYKEELQEPFAKLQELLHNDLVRETRKKFLQEGEQKYFDILTLGSFVTYSNRCYDIQTLFLEYGRNKNVLAISSKAEDLAYLEKLLKVNFDTSPRKEMIGMDYQHEVFCFQPIVDPSIFSGVQQHTNPDEAAELETVFLKKKMLYELFRECHTPYEFVLGNYHKNLELQRQMLSMQERASMEEQAAEVLKTLFGEISMEDIPEACTKIQAGEHSEEEKILARNLLDFYNYKKNPYAVFPPSVYWFIGIDAMERIPEWLFQAMKNGMNYNTLFIMMASTEFDQMTQLVRYCDYIFAGGANQRIYERLQMNYTRRQADSIVLDLNIKSMGEERSFKKYRRKFEQKKAPSIDFDKILGKGKKDVL